MNLRGRKILVSSLSAVFLFQSWMVYTDPQGRDSPPLSEQAAYGMSLWRTYNCQSCHQLYGYGGFLGRDLTNAAPELTASRMESVLTVGVGQMPAFHLEVEEREAVLAFLAEMNETGVGQLLLSEPASGSEVLQGLLEAWLAEGNTLAPLQQVGRDVVLREQCIDCHLPNLQGTYQAPVMTGLLPRLGRGGVTAIVEAGIPAKAMPRISLTAEEQEGLVAFLGWMADHAEVIHDTFATSAAAAADQGGTGLPWFEYR